MTIVIFFLIVGQVSQCVWNHYAYKAIANLGKRIDRLNTTRK